MKYRALGLVIILLMMCDIPASESDDDTYHLYKEYRDDLYALQKDITHLYGELNQGKNAQAVYEHLLQTVEKTAVLLGKAELASKDIHENLQISLQDHIELTLVRGLSEPHKENLAALYTEKEITELLDWLFHYNDYNRHAVMGFTPEEIERFYHLGLTDEHIDALQTIMNDHYTNLYTAQQFVKEHQTELMHIQVSLSVVALQILSELNTHRKEKSTLQNVEEKLFKAMLTVSDDKSSLEKVKALSKQMYKAAEQKVRKGSNEYLIDFFIGLQIHCGSLTALNGDTYLGLSEIRFYTNCVSECVSPERPPLLMGENLDLGQSLSVPMEGFVGSVEEFDETNNMGVTYVFVKGSDTTLLQSILLLVSFITCIGQPEFSLHHVANLLAFTITPTVIIVGAAGAALLLIITAPAVGHEWPPAVPGWIEGDEIIIVVEGSYGQGHIAERAQSDEPCIAGSHQAILDDKYMIQKIVRNATKLLFNPHNGQYVYYYVDGGKEWAVFVEEYENDYYQLITAYKADCYPFKCEGKEFNTIIKKWICEGFNVVSLW